MAEKCVKQNGINDVNEIQVKLKVNSDIKQMHVGDMSDMGTGTSNNCNTDCTTSRDNDEQKRNKAQPSSGTSKNANFDVKNSTDNSAVNFNGTNSTEAKENGVANINCSSCIQQSREDPAVQYCLDCQESYCLKCVEMHGYFSSLRDHTLVSLQEKDRPENIRSHVPTERCPRHPSKMIDMYCKNHDTVACSVCFLPHYKLCSDIHYVPDVASQFADKASSAKAKVEVAKAEENLDDIVESCEDVLTELDKARDTSLIAIKEYNEHLKAVLNDLEKKTVDELEKKHSEVTLSVQAEIEKAKALKELVKQRSVRLKELDSNMSRVFVTQTLGKQITGEADSLVKSIQKSVSKVRLFYKNDVSIVTHLKSHPGIGFIRDHKRLFGHLKRKMKYDIKSDDDTEQCNVWGSCVTGNGDVLLADNNNNKLKLLDKASYKMSATCTLPASPRSLSKVNDSEVAVSLSNKCIYFITTSNGALEIKSFKQLEHNCFGLALTAGEMFISDGSNQVYSYGLTGELHRIFSQDPSGEPLFSESRDITISDDGKRIHVADSRKGLVTLSKEGKILWRYSGSELKGAYGVCTDGEENLLVTGILSNNVVQFGSHGEKLGEIIDESDDIQNPVSVCYDPYNECVLVSKNGNYMFAFDFE